MSPRSERSGHLSLPHARQCLKLRVKNWEQNSLQLQDDAFSGILELEANSAEGQQLQQEVKKWGKKESQKKRLKA